MVTIGNKDKEFTISSSAKQFKHFKTSGLLCFINWNIKTKNKISLNKSYVSEESKVTPSSIEIEAMMTTDVSSNLYKRAVLRNKTSYDEYKREVFKICSNTLKVSYTEINDKYMINFLIESKLKIFYCINDATTIKDIQSEMEKMFYKSYHIYHENRISQRETFMKSNRDILITQASFLLSYLRQGLINLKDVNYLIFEPKKLMFGEEN